MPNAGTRKSKARARTPLREAGLLAAAALLGPFLTRSVLIAERDTVFSALDLRGFFSDLVISLFFFTALALACRWTRWLALALLVFWAVLSYANYEHVMVLGSPASLSQAHYLVDPTFFRGSVLSPTHPLLLAGLLCGSLVLGWLGSRPRSTVMPLLPVGAAAILGLCVHLLWPPDAEALAWRQANVVYENLRWLIEPSARPARITQTVSDQIESLYRADLNGEPILELGRRDTNVLLVLLEAISGVHMDSIAERHGIASSIKLPRLDRIAQDNLAYRSFVSHQRQTNRGEYAILCGDYPKLVVDEPKMTEVLALDNVVCLPNVLRDAGYETVYLQAAPLGFMSKDLFMPKIGFSQVYGERWFKRAYARNQWGVDDRAYFEQSLEMVRRLGSAKKPWFLTLLTVGTHHPYIVPRSYGNRTFASAASYLDEAFAEFLGQLQAEGLLKNTLVMITSDESVGIAGYRGHKREGAGEGLDDLTKRLTDNWGFLIVIPPTGEQMRVDTEFMQVDLALSILDYLGLASEAQEFVGRSVFRRYEGTRPIVFANVYKRWLGALDPSG
ncbi:MAG: LTA synthase family protein, partial [Deltaproteobacteria bacterium]